jgi:hypothetical protein
MTSEAIVRRTETCSKCEVPRGHAITPTLERLLQREVSEAEAQDFVTSVCRQAGSHFPPDIGSSQEDGCTS